MPCVMYSRMSSRETPWAASSCAAYDFDCWSVAASTSPDCTSWRPALCTCSTAVCSTRRNAIVCSGSFCWPRENCSMCSSRYLSRSRRSCGRSAPHAARMRSPSGSCASAYTRCSSVRCVCRRAAASRYATVRITSSEGLNTFSRLPVFPSSLGFHRSAEREPLSARQFDHGVDLRLGDLERVHAAEPLALRMDGHHDAIRLGGRLVEDRLENLHHEIHRGVVVVEQQDLEQLGLLGFLSGPFEDFAFRVTLWPGHRYRSILAPLRDAGRMGARASAASDITCRGRASAPEA